MSARERDQQTMRRLLREYLVGTLSDADLRRVETRLSESSDWRDALEAERDAVALLDLLPEAEPSESLTDRVLQAVREGDMPTEPAVPLQRRLVVYGLMAACVVVAAIVATPAVRHLNWSANSAASMSNLKRLGVVFKMYSNESKGEKFPPLAPYKGVWTVDVRAIYPKYLPEMALLVNPVRPDADELVERLEELVAEDPVDWEEVTRIVAKSYVYTGWSVMNAEDLDSLSRQYAKLDPRQYDEDVDTQEGTVYRLREGIERFFISDINNPAATAKAQSEVPVVFEAVYKGRRPKGINVLFMDGHVEFIPYGDAFPALPEVDALLATPE